MKFSHQQAHDQKIANKRDRAVAQVKADKPLEPFRPAMICAVPPGVALVPEKVVYDCRLYGQYRRDQVVRPRSAE
jgi:hypothetical protein